VKSYTRSGIQQKGQSIESGRKQVQLGLDGESDGEGETELQRAQRQVLTNGQRFRHRVMNDLFNSPTSGAVCRT
jgi:hypothetical protein